jgi:hypothetical protein
MVFSSIFRAPAVAHTNMPLPQARPAPLVCGAMLDFRQMAFCPLGEKHEPLAWRSCGPGPKARQIAAHAWSRLVPFEALYRLRGL